MNVPRLRKDEKGWGGCLPDASGFGFPMFWWVDGNSWPTWQKSIHVRRHVFFFSSNKMYAAAVAFVPGPMGQWDGLIPNELGCSFGWKIDETCWMRDLYIGYIPPKEGDYPIKMGLYPNNRGSIYPDKKWDDWRWPPHGAQPSGAVRVQPLLQPPGWKVSGPGGRLVASWHKDGDVLGDGTRLQSLRFQHVIVRWSMCWRGKIWNWKLDDWLAFAIKIYVGVPVWQNLARALLAVLSLVVENAWGSFSFQLQLTWLWVKLSQNLGLVSFDDKTLTVKSQKI